MSLDLPDEIYDRYSCGWCMHLAAALHRQLGWRIQAVVSQGQDPDYIEHAWVIDPTGTHMLDIDGLNPIATNGWIRSDNTFHDDITESQLKALTLAGCYNAFDDDTWNCEVNEALNDILSSEKIKEIFLEDETGKGKKQVQRITSLPSISF